MRLSSSIESIKGIGEKTAIQLRLAGLDTVDDMLHFFPRRYDDFGGVVAITDLTPGKVSIRAKCERVETKTVRRGLKLTTAVFADDSSKIKAVWFNQPYRETQLRSNDTFYVTGNFEFQYNTYQITNPSVEKVNQIAESGSEITPVYRAVHGVKPLAVQKIMRTLKPLMTVLPETLPEDITKNQSLCSRAQAVASIHFPSNRDELVRAKERIAFEELFAVLLASQLNKQEHTKLTGRKIPFNAGDAKKFVANLPFALTNAQRIAVWDILQDFERATPMNRLLQGDVGAGKTVVAGMAAHMAAGAGFQTAIMAPTEILARQHAETLQHLLGEFGIRVGLLVGAVKGKARQTLYEQIANGEVDIVVGTHALIQSTVAFHNLGFVVIDEQHRFGVKQRQALLQKSTRLPHLLAMTATPIPRSLALTVYGELEVSILNEKPANRKPIITKLISPVSRDTMYTQVDAELAAGRQAYVICNLIDENQENDKKSVEAEYKRLKNSVFGHRKIALLHGKMPASEKESIMLAFKNHEFDILVSTTVVEVGVDVPNATVMIIEDANYFGLSQLHQLRGRVGRSELQSYCYLMLADSSKPSQRLREIEASNDGFHLAEVDLELRGPGEIYGRAQHGELNFQVAKLTDTKLIARAQKEAKQWVARLDELGAHPDLMEQVSHYQRLTTLN